MWKNMLSAELSRREFFQVIARNLMRSRVTQFIVAVSVAAIGILLAYLCWENREFVGGAVAILLGVGALMIGLELLPFPAEIRARWDWEADMAERYPSYRFKNLLLLGIALLASTVWGDRDRIFSDEWAMIIWKLAIPLALIVAGAIATVVWHTRHAKHHVFRYPETERTVDGIDLSRRT